MAVVVVVVVVVVEFRPGFRDSGFWGSGFRGVSGSFLGLQGWLSKF